ncbi:hypothetical protein [Streptomyces sp. NPDC002547]
MGQPCRAASPTDQGWAPKAVPPGCYTSLDNKICVHLDDDRFDYHIDAKPGYRPSVMRAILRHTSRRGLELIPDDEEEPEILEDGTIRIYLTTASTDAFADDGVELCPLSELMTLKAAA